MKDNVEIRKHKRTIEKRRPFVLIGNEIDGRVFGPLMYNFKSFADLKKRLPEILISIKGEGEWIFELYQVEKDYKIWHRYGYYQYPNRGKRVFKYSYMNCPLKAVEINKTEIILFGDYLLFKDSRYNPIRHSEIRQIKINWKSSSNRL